MKKIKLLIISLGLLMVGSFMYSAVQNMSEFGGVNTDWSPLFLSNQTPDSENVATDDGPGISPRSGYIIFSTETSKNLFSFYTSNGDKYLVTQASNTIKATIGGGTFSIFISTVDPNKITYFAGLGDKLFFCNQTDGLKYWDTSTVSKVNPYKPKFVAVHKAHLFMAGIAGDERTLYISRFQDGTSFALDINPTDESPAQIPIQGALDDVITGVYSSFNDQLIWFKQRSFGGIQGDRNSNWAVFEYSNKVGCVYPDSVQNCNGLLRWLGNDRIIYEFDGASYHPINQDIDTYMSTIEQGDLNLRQWSQSSAADWNSGTIGVGLDTTSVIGDVGLYSTASSTSVFLATGTLRNVGQSDNIYVNASTATTGAFAVKYVADSNMDLNKVTMSFFYKSSAAVNYQSWVTLHTGSTYPSSVALDTATNRVTEQTNSSGLLTKITTDYFFQSSGDAGRDKRLAAGNIYWFVMHTTFTKNTTVSNSVFAFNGSTSPLVTPTTQYFTIPIGVSSITIDMYGASGSTNSSTTPYGAAGGFVHSTNSVTYGDTLAVLVGGFGGMSGVNYFNLNLTNPSPYCFNSGNHPLTGSDAASRPCGGGATDIRISPYGLTNRIAVAGGGGGQQASASGDGGVGGGTTGGNGLADGTDPSANGGTGGTQSAGGTGGTGGSANGQDGSFGVGGTYSGLVAGGYGGGGWYGGGSGGRTNSNYGGGGGGSSYSPSASASFASGVNYGNGIATISYILNPEFYTSEISAPIISSTTLLYTSSFVASGANYRTGNFASEFQVYLASTIGSSTFTTRAFDAGSLFNEWGAFGSQESSAGNGSVVYKIFTDTDSTIDPYDPTTYTDSQVISNGQTPAIPVARYVTMQGIYSRGVNFATNTIMTHSMTINFSEGSSIRTFGDFIRNRYWLSVAVSSTSNNRVLVYDRNKQWQIYNGINVSALINYSGTFYFGDNAGIFQLDYGTDDNGTPITAYYKTKTYAPSGADTFSTFNDVYMTTINSSSTLTSQYYVDEYGVPINMSDYNLNSKLGYQNFRIPFSDTSMPRGKYISFKWSISSSLPWRILNANLYFDSDKFPSE